MPNKRHGLSVISTVTNKGQMRWRIFDGALNTTILIDFLHRLIKGQSTKLFLILGNLRVHHAKQVKTWLAGHADAIEVFYLPSYSPELNPDEMANADIKQAVTKQAPARTKLQLVKATARHLRSVQRQPERIRKYFEHGPVRYAARGKFIGAGSIGAWLHGRKSSTCETNGRTNGCDRRDSSLSLLRSQKYAISLEEPTAPLTPLSPPAPHSPKNSTNSPKPARSVRSWFSGAAGSA